MKFQIREGFVAQVSTKVEMPNGQIEVQTQNYFGGQVADLTAEQAEQHTQKLEPKDKAAEAFLAAKVAPATPGAALGLSPEALALVEAMATAMAGKIVAAVQAPAPAPAGA